MEFSNNSALPSKLCFVCAYEHDIASENKKNTKLRAKTNKNVIFYSYILVSSTYDANKIEKTNLKKVGNFLVIFT